MVAENEIWFPTRTAPYYGDIAWGRFPLNEVRGPGPKERPVLILAARKHVQRETEFVTVQVAYGTSKLNRASANPRKHLIIENVQALNMARLYQATRFDLSRIKWMPWSERWFRADEVSGTPVMGRLPDSYIQKLDIMKTVRDL